MPRSYTFTFVKRGNLEVQVDVWVPEAPAPSPLPILVWYHGGGLVQGNRKALAAHHKRAVDEKGIVIVSPDYRLAPQVRVPDIQSDIVALTRYVHDLLQTDLLSSGEQSQLDLGRIAVSGSSAGGWIAYWIGLGMIQGLPSAFLSGIRAIAPIYPITTMDHPFFLTAQTPFMGRLSNPPSDFDPFKDVNGPVMCNTAELPLRNKLYMHAQQEALFPTLLFSEEQIRDGWLRKSDVSQFVYSASLQQCQAWAPVYMVHGVLDSAVAIDQARSAQKALQSINHPVTLEERADKDHLWDLLEPDEKFERYWHFLSEHLGLI